MSNFPQWLERPRDDQRLWRYLDLARFAAILDAKALFFPRADKLDDLFEGSYPMLNVEQRKDEYHRLFQHDYPDNASSRFDTRAETFINCWHMNEHESDAMWKLYAREHAGIAIRSTFRRLTQSLGLRANDGRLTVKDPRGPGIDVPCFVGKVKYIDYRTQTMPEGNLFFPFFHKRMSFAHECELRAVIWCPLTTIEDGRPAPLDLPGLSVDVRLHTLIEGVYVSPRAAPWFAEVVKSLARKYGLRRAPKQSSLADDPVW